MTNPDAVSGLSRRTLLQAATLAPLAATLPLVTQTVAATPASAASYTTVWPNTLHSAATGLDHDWALTYPAGHSTDEHLPVAIVLHGSNQRATTMIGGGFGGLGYPERLDALIAAGTSPAFALASIDAGNSYYGKVGGRDYGALVADEFLGLLAARGLDTSRLALMGWSMGGWGAFRLAQHELRGRVKVIAAASTPCYPSWTSMPRSERADMTRAQFDANNFSRRPALLANVPVYVLCGTKDAFYKGNVAFAKALDKTRAKTVHKRRTRFVKAGHTTSFWRSVASTQLQYVGHYL